LNLSPVPLVFNQTFIYLCSSSAFIYVHLRLVASFLYFKAAFWTSRESALHVGLGSGMSALFKALGNAADGEGRYGNPEVVALDLVAEGFGLLDQLGVGGAAEGASEAGGDAAFQAALDFVEQEFTGFDSEFLGGDGRESACDLFGSSLQVPFPRGGHMDPGWTRRVGEL
jgi:hypothetical protein